MKRYVGELIPGADPACRIYREEDGRRTELDLRLDLVRHSPTGFNWGYGGSGPAQAALAILADHLGDERAMDLYQAFKWRFVAALPRDRGWELSGEDLDRIVEEISADPGPGPVAA